MFIVFYYGKYYTARKNDDINNNISAKRAKKRLDISDDMSYVTEECATSQVNEEKAVKSEGKFYE